MNDIQVIDKELIENLTITNYWLNEKHCIVINNENGKKNIDYILLNIYAYSYVKNEYTIHDLPCFYEYYKNGFFYYKNWNKKDEINKFLEKYNKYFIEEITTDFMRLFNTIIKEIERLNKKGEL